MKALIAAGVASLLILVGCSAPSEGTSKPAASSTAAGGGQPSGAASEEAPAQDDWYSTTYGTFNAVSKKAKGDAVVKLPKGAMSALVTATHKGRSNFAIQVLDADNQPTTDLLVNTIGSYSGTTALGLSNLGGDPAKLKVKADGSWTLKIQPISQAPKMKAAGSGDTVFKYEENAADFAVTHNGKSNFAVIQHSDNPMPNLAVNEIGKYAGTVPFDGGPSVVTVQADGKWTFQKK